MIPTKLPTIFLAFEFHKSLRFVRKYYLLAGTHRKGPLATNDEYLSLLTDNESVIIAKYYPELLI